MLERPQEMVPPEAETHDSTTAEGHVGPRGDGNVADGGPAIGFGADTGGASNEETVTLTLMGSASKADQDAGYDLFSSIAAAIDNAKSRSESSATSSPSLKLSLQRSRDSSVVSALP